jgi:hypothetical protein
VDGTPHDVFCTTLRSTMPLYEAAGFILLQATEVPM